MKKKQIAGILAVSLLTAVPFTTGFAEGPKWTNVNVIEEQDGSKFNSENYDFMKFSQIGTKLTEIQKQSNRVKVEVRGTSADGHPLYVVTIADPTTQGKFGKIQSLRKQMFKNPGKAQDWINNNPDFKVPIMINGSIHGTEFVGSDAVIQLIERFATQNDAETKKILENNILIFNVVQNPDGRVDATRFNGEGIDLNRDFITQSQPETKETVELIKEWNPMVFLDTHGYVKNYGPNLQGLIEPCTPPHNPNYEYDLYNKWALNQAKAMEASILGDKNYTSNLYKEMKGVYVPQRDDEAGWDDYPPIFTPMYAMYHGAYGHTLEAPTNDLDGVRWMYNAIMGALNYATENKQGMINDQIEMFKRGINFDHPFHEEGFFPNAYILPVNQNDPTVTAKAVNHLLNNDIEVTEATKEFTVDGKTYPKGTYLVQMDQAKAGLANTMLWDGEDISNDTTAMYDISAWSLPELWGFEAVETSSPVDVTAKQVNQVTVQGAVTGKGPFVIPNSSVKAIELVNKLLKQGVSVSRDVKGNFYTNAEANKISAAVKESGLQIGSIASVPSDASVVSSLQVAILKDGGMGKVQSHSGTKLALKRLGFEVTEVTPVEVAEKGLDGFDVFVYSGTESLIATNLNAANKEFGFQSADQLTAFQGNVNSFVDNGGKYIAVGAGASRATKTLGLTDVVTNTAGSNSNGIVKVNYDGTGLTAGYDQDDLGFVYRPAWYTVTDNEEVAATLANSDDFFVAGHWRTNKLPAKGQAVIVKEDKKDVTLIGLEAGFRDHTDYLFRLLSNAIFEE
jgi:Zinc carboxypeptidase